MAALGMWEDMLSVVDNDIDGDESRLFVQEDNWDGSQYIRFAWPAPAPCEAQDEYLACNALSAMLIKESCITGSYCV